MKLFEITFYQLYVWFSQFFDNEDEPAHSAWLALSFLIFIDILGINWLIEGVLGTDIVLRITENYLVTIGAAITLMIVTRYLWYRIPKRKKIIETLGSTSLEEKEKNKKIAVGFMVLSFLFWISSMIVYVFVLGDPRQP